MVICQLMIEKLLTITLLMLQFDQLTKKKKSYKKLIKYT